MLVVTGGAGFIGSNVVAALEGRGRAVAVVDRLGDDERWRNLAKRELVDLLPPEETFAFLEARRNEVEGVVHLGAVSATTERDVDRLVEMNVRPTLGLVEWCTRRGVPLVYASSAATYGDGSAGFDDDDSPQALARLRPLNAYGWSKQVVDRRVARLRAEGGPLPPQVVGLKFFNVYGPNEYHKGDMRSVAHKVFEQVRGGGAARLFRSQHPDYPDGGQMRDFVWVGDCVDLVLWLLDHPEVSGVFNCGSGKARSFLDLAHAVFAALGEEPRIEWTDMPAELAGRYQYFTEAPMERIRRLGWTQPATSLEDGVRTYVRDFLLAEDPYR